MRFHDNVLLTEVSIATDNISAFCWKYYLSIILRLRYRYLYSCLDKFIHRYVLHVSLLNVLVQVPVT